MTGCCGNGAPFVTSVDGYVVTESCVAAGALGGVIVTVRVATAPLFAASRATTVSTFVPDCSAMPLTDHELVPVAVPAPPRSLAHVTCVTPTLSDAVPPIDTVDSVVEYVPLAGV